MLNAFTSSCDLYRAKLFCLIIDAIDDFIQSFSESALIAIPAITVTNARFLIAQGRGFKNKEPETFILYKNFNQINNV